VIKSVSLINVHIIRSTPPSQPILIKLASMSVHTSLHTSVCTRVRPIPELTDTTDTDTFGQLRYRYRVPIPIRQQKWLHDTKCRSAYVCVLCMYVFCILYNGQINSCSCQACTGIVWQKLHGIPIIDATDSAAGERRVNVTQPWSVHGIGTGIGASIGATDIVPIPVVSADTRYRYRSKPSLYTLDLWCNFRRVKLEQLCTSLWYVISELLVICLLTEQNCPGQTCEWWCTACTCSRE